MYDKTSPFSKVSPPARRDSFTDVAHSTLRMAIIECRLLPGKAVSEAELANRFGFGLAAIRAALMRLTASGWISPDGRRGSMVLPISAEHLADLATSRLCLEPNLLRHAPPVDLEKELRLRAEVFHAAAVLAPRTDNLALLHQERALLLKIATVIAAPRIRTWLVDTWELCLRADRHLGTEFGIVRDPLPLSGLASALAKGNGQAAADLLTQMRNDFDLRLSRALSRSRMPLADPCDLRESAPVGATALGRSAFPPRHSSAKGDLL